MILIHTVSATNASVLKSIRLHALRDSPTAFSSTFSRESSFSDNDWLQRASNSISESSVAYLAMDMDIACGIVRGSSDDQDSSVIWVESMWVAPSHRRNGIGRMLVNRVLDWARDRNAREVKLEVTNSNESAIPFYQSLGFKLTGKNSPYVNDSRLTECEMLLSLS
jgi:ribosomal protein S18 acetylase RimI-like enzyme